MAAQTHTLQFLKSLADDEVTLAMQNLAAALSQLEQARTQGEMLNQYQQEYSQQWQQASQRGIQIELYRNFQGFFRQLEQAVSGQNVQIDHLQQLVEEKQQALQAIRRKQKSYEVLLERAALAEHATEHKREQKLMDEFASRAKRKLNV